MKIKEVMVGLSRTYNIGNYESFKIEGAVAASLDDDDDPQEVADELRPILRESMRRTYREFAPKKDKK